MNTQRPADAMTRHPKLLAWVEEVAELCKPEAIHWCSGSQTEYDTLCELMVHAGTLLRLNPDRRLNSFLCRSDPRDVARVENHPLMMEPLDLQSVDDRRYLVDVVVDLADEQRDGEDREILVRVFKRGIAIFVEVDDQRHREGLAHYP